MVGNQRHQRAVPPVLWRDALPDYRDMYEDPDRRAGKLFLAKTTDEEWVKNHVIADLLRHSYGNQCRCWLRITASEISSTLSSHPRPRSSSLFSQGVKETRSDESRSSYTTVHLGQTSDTQVVAFFDRRQIRFSKNPSASITERQCVVGRCTFEKESARDRMPWFLRVQPWVL